VSGAGRGRSPAGSIVLALIAGAVLMVVSDPDVITQYAYLFTAPGLPLGASWAKVSSAYGALVLGAVGSPNALAATAWQAAPLICAGLGVGLGFRAGLFNIGAQGQAIWGSIAAAYLGFALQLPPVIHLIVAVIGGLIAGAIWGGIVGFLKAQDRRARGHRDDHAQLHRAAGARRGCCPRPPSCVRAASTRSPRCIHDTAAFPIIFRQLNVGFLVALAAAVAVWWLLERSTLGFAIRAVGANPERRRDGRHERAQRHHHHHGALGPARCGLAGVQYALGPGAERRRHARCRSGWSARSASTPSRSPCWGAASRSASCSRACCSVACTPAACRCRASPDPADPVHRAAGAHRALRRGARPRGRVAVRRSRPLPRPASSEVRHDHR
jgi:ABC-type uncharacterized transport system permease subunit